jgi:hypothetical protein
VSRVLIRFSKRLAIWEPGHTPEEIQHSEFRQKDGAIDLRPSVYEIQDSEVVRAFAEHATMISPPSSSAGIDLGGPGSEVESTPGKTGFSFTTSAHRELALKSKEDLFNLIGRVLAGLGSRLHHVTRAQIMTYAKARLAAMDPEWQRAIAHSKPGTWIHKLASVSAKTDQ